MQDHHRRKKVVLSFIYIWLDTWSNLHIKNTSGANCGRYNYVHIYMIYRWSYRAGLTKLYVCLSSGIGKVRGQLEQEP